MTKVSTPRSRARRPSSMWPSIAAFLHPWCGPGSSERYIEGTWVILAASAISPMMRSPQRRDRVRPVGDADVLGLHVEIEAVVPAVAADPAVLHPAEGGGKVPVVLRVHPDHPRIDRPGHSKRPARVSSPKVGGEAIVGVVRDLDRFLLGIERDHGERRAEDLLLRDSHTPRCPGEEDGSNVVSASELLDALPSGGDRGLLLPRGRDVTQHFLEVLAGDERPDVGLRVQGMSHAKIANAPLESGEKGVLKGAGEEKAATRRAALSVEAVDHEDHGVEGAIEVGVLEDDDWVLPTELEVDALQGRRPLGHDAPSGDGFSYEGDGPDGGMLRQSFPGDFAKSMNGVPYAVGKTRRLARLRQDRSGERAELGGLVHHGAAGGERGRDLPGREHEGRVPGRDDPDGADGRSHRVVEVLVLEKGEPVSRLGRLVGEEAEVLGAPQGCGFHEADGLAGVHALDERNLLPAPADEI